MLKMRSILALCLALVISVFASACAAAPVAAGSQPETVNAQSETAAEANQDRPEPTATAVPTPEPTPEPTPAPVAFSIAWMSDTQVYTAANSDVFGKMTQWVADTQQEYNTVLAVHTGDLVYNAYREYEWDNELAAFSNLPEGMHILTCAGNHDELPDYDPATPYLDHRPDTDFDPAHAFDEKGFSYYTTFVAGGVPVIVFSIAYGMEVDAENWINEVCKEYSDHYAILCMHNYMFLGGYSSVGKRLIENVVKQSPNVRLVLCGHERGMQYIPEVLDDNADGTPDRTVHQMMMNVQDDQTNGVGYLRLLRFDPAADTIEVVTYSPVLDRYGYEVAVGGDRFGGNKILEDAGLRDFLTQSAP
ncbi:MAG TPA: metallophosphoesterase [Clostridia bacterium]|nr:metallophosphoesterase [Clostridia bacterium]